MADLAVHMFLVRGVLIDTGFPAARADVIQLSERESIRGVMVTHEHEDHAGNAAWFAERGVPMAMSMQTWERIRTPQRIGLYRHFTWGGMSPIVSQLVPFADATMSLLHAPGHSDDHHVVWDHETGTLFAGDLFLGVKVRIAHSHESPRALLHSLRAMIALAPSRVFCAHRGLLPHGATLLEAKADWVESTIALVESLARQGHSISTIRKRVLGARTLTDVVSAGEYSTSSLVRAMLRESTNVPPSAPRAHQ